MKTLYGLTEAQMWEVYRACRLENWKEFTRSITDNWYEIEELSDEDLEDIADNALYAWDNHCDIRGEIESQIVEEAISDWLSAHNEED